MIFKPQKALVALSALAVLGGCQYSRIETFDKSVPRGWEYVAIKNTPKTQAAPPVTPQAQELKKYTLDAQSLFAIGKSDLSVKGQAQVQTAGGEISNDLPNIRQVNVIGYTDPVGNDSDNQALSLERAQSVAAMLQKSGVPADIIRTEGRGSQDLVVSDCALRFKRDKTGLDACNMPNRRVVISVIGMQPQPGVPTYINSHRNEKAAPQLPSQINEEFIPAAR